MITIGDKNKVLFFDLIVEGANKTDLDIWFCIKNDNIIYSFHGEIQDDKIKIVIPPLSKMITKEYLDYTKIYPAFLKAIYENKYMVITWEGEGQIEQPIKINAVLNNMTNIESKQGQNITHMIQTKILNFEEEKDAVPEKPAVNYKMSLLDDILGKN